MDTDLEEVIRDRENIVLTPSHIKSYMIMMLTGLEYLHANWILHRVGLLLIKLFEFLIKLSLMFKMLHQQFLKFGFLHMKIIFYR